MATLLTVYSLRSRAGFVSHRQRSWDSPFGAFSSRKVSGVLPPGRAHLPLNLAVFPPPKRRAGPTGRGSLGSALLGYSGEDLGRDFAPPPLTRFTDPATNHRVHQRPRVSISLRSASSRQPCRSTAVGQSNPSRVSAPAQSRAFKRESHRAMGSPPAVPYIAAGHPAVFGRIVSLYRSCPGFGLGAEHLRPQRREVNVAQERAECKSKTAVFLPSSPPSKTYAHRRFANPLSAAD